MDKKVAVVMGSESDLKIMKGACEILEQFEVGFVVRILSAHRTPEQVISWVDELNSDNYQVIIAGAGGAAHLAGVIAAHTTLPVIGVPISSSLRGMDALLSTVQMPSGIPVATVGIDMSKNAALFSLAILALNDKIIKSRLEEYRVNMQKEVTLKDRKLMNDGWKKNV